MKYEYHNNKVTNEFCASVFVFGSNLAGIHGAGAAAWAVENRDAKYGVGLGLTGNAYALPTKDYGIQTLPLDAIEFFVKGFLTVAKREDRTFFVTAVGCGLAGYVPANIAPLFIGAPTNCIFPIEWKPFLEQA